MLYFILSVLWVAAAMAQDLPTDETTLFSGSGNCQMCHVSNGVAMTQDGVDISPVTQWRATMMGNSAKDPLWRAKVATELAAFPQHADLIQNRCTVCHVPAGNTQTRFDGDSTYNLAQLDENALHRDGVTCSVCHQIQPNNLGTPQSYGGGYEITDARMIFGPFADPLPGPMQNHVNYTPVEGEHTRRSELCATCHTLITPTLNAAGEIIGEFPEQTPYIEWKNSFYANQTSCQDCHMRAARDPQDIALMPPWHTEMRAPYMQHAFVGGNVSMLRLLRDNADSLGVTATAAQFDSTIAETQRSLTQRSCELDLDAQAVGDSILLTVTLTNLTGHKLPTGIPLRRMWLAVDARDGNGQTVFQSGAVDEAGEIVGYDFEFEPHYDFITAPDQVQVYEAVMGDDSGARTWTLLRAGAHLKDNRLPPLGFTSTHASYDTTEIFGVADSDDNFNRANGIEGSGADVVTYRLPRASAVTVAVLFQTVQPRLVNYLAQHDTPETQRFAQMYAEQTIDPQVLAVESLVLMEVSAESTAIARDFAVRAAYPNPFNAETRIRVDIAREQMVEFSLYDIRGRRVMLFGRMMHSPSSELTLDARDLPSGVYMLQARAGEVRDTQRLILLK